MNSVSCLSGVYKLSSLFPGALSRSFKNKLDIGKSNNVCFSNMFHLLQCRPCDVPRIVSLSEYSREIVQKARKAFVS